MANDSKSSDNIENMDKKIVKLERDGEWASFFSKTALTTVIVVALGYIAITSFIINQISDIKIEVGNLTNAVSTINGQFNVFATSFEAFRNKYDADSNNTTAQLNAFTTGLENIQSKYNDESIVTTAQFNAFTMGFEEFQNKYDADSNQMQQLAEDYLQKLQGNSDIVVAVPWIMDEMSSIKFPAVPFNIVKYPGIKWPEPLGGEVIPMMPNDEQSKNADDTADSGINQ